MDTEAVAHALVGVEPDGDEWVGRAPEWSREIVFGGVLLGQAVLCGHARVARRAQDPFGAVARVGEAETAFNGRAAGHTFNINGNSKTSEGFEAEREWARSYWSALKPFHTSVYVNFLMEESRETIQDAYGATKYERLRTLKRKCDPENFFHLNQNISPA